VAILITRGGGAPTYRYAARKPAATMSASAAHGLEERVVVIAESVIDQFLQSFDNSTIAKLHSGIGYTFGHGHHGSAHTCETRCAASA